MAAAMNGARPSKMDAILACEKNSSAKEDSSHNMRLLPETYEPGDHDVLCGRGRKCFNHPGNVKFRAIVQTFLPQYSKAVAKLEKSYILSDVVEQVRKNSGIGGFIKKDPDTGRWYEVGDFLAREKTSQAFRDILHDKYKSSNTAKKKRRQEEQAEKFFRTHSSRSLGDTSSVHSVGSSTTGDYMMAATGDYMLSDSKLMRLQSSERLGLGEDESQHSDLLGALDQDIASAGSGGFGSVGRPRMMTQGSLRSVLDIDSSNRRAFMKRSASAKNSSWYNRSCPNLLPPLDPAAGNTNAPPVTQIEIIEEEEGTQNAELEENWDELEPPVPEPDQSMSNNPHWFHHSQPNLFSGSRGGPNFGMGMARRPFARQPPKRMARLPSSGSGNFNMLAVQKQIGNLGLGETSGDNGNMMNQANTQSMYDFGDTTGFQNAPDMVRSGNANSNMMSDAALLNLDKLQQSLGIDAVDDNPFEPVPIREG